MFGRHVYAIGGNLTAATLSGVKVKWVNFGIMLNMGFLAGVAGVLFSAKLNSANPQAGNYFELDAIAAAFIGGAAVTGGVGKVSGAIVGGLIMATMSNGMQHPWPRPVVAVHDQGPRAAARSGVRCLQQASGWRSLVRRTFR